jgi:hypothetical protein
MVKIKLETDVQVKRIDHRWRLVGQTSVRVEKREFAREFY